MAAALKVLKESPKVSQQNIICNYLVIQLSVSQQSVWTMLLGSLQFCFK
jgi:hypothetical protein